MGGSLESSGSRCRSRHWERRHWKSRSENVAAGFWSIALLLTAIAATALAPDSALAQQPGRTITIVVPFTPGTGPDILARVLGDEIQQRWSQPVVVENKPGASGNIGTQVAARVGPGRPHPAADHLAVHPERLAVQERALRSRWPTSRPSSSSPTRSWRSRSIPRSPRPRRRSSSAYLKARPGRSTTPPPAAARRTTSPWSCSSSPPAPT